MWKLTVLNSVSPKLRPNTVEKLDAHTRNWYTDGYRASAPGTKTCRQDSDCDGAEICQAGYCAGLHRKYDSHGLYYGNEYQDLFAPDASPLGYLNHGEYYRPHDYFYDYAFGDQQGYHYRTQEPIEPHYSIVQHTDYGHNYDYDYH